MKTNIQTIPHEPNGNRYIAHLIGTQTYIVQEKYKEQCTFLYVAMVGNVKERQQIIDALLANLNK